MRISDWSSDVCSSDLGECRADGGSAFGPGSFFGSTKSKAPTYNFGVDWAVSDDAFFYVTTRRGYRAGELNTPRLAQVPATFQSFGPQKVTDYAAGAKLPWRTGGWYGRFNIAAFTAQFIDLHLQLTRI